MCVFNEILIFWWRIFDDFQLKRIRTFVLWWILLNDFSFTFKTHLSMKRNSIRFVFQSTSVSSFMIIIHFSFKRKKNQKNTIKRASALNFVSNSRQRPKIALNTQCTWQMSEWWAGKQTKNERTFQNSRKDGWE